MRQRLQGSGEEGGPGMHVGSRCVWDHFAADLPQSPLTHTQPSCTAGLRAAMKTLKAPSMCSWSGSVWRGWWCESLPLGESKPWGIGSNIHGHVLRPPAQLINAVRAWCTQGEGAQQ